MRPKKTRPAPNATIHRLRVPSEVVPAARLPVALSTPPQSTFHAECTSAIERIRGAIHTLCSSVDADPLRPQEISRRLRLNKNLTWKFARVLVAENTMDAVAMLPGPEGIEIFLRAFEVAGAGAVELMAARHAGAVFAEIVARHFVARTEVELALDGLRADQNLENSRRLAFRGLSGTLGMHAHARFTIQIVAPSTGSTEFADVAMVAGISRIRCLRPRESLPVFRWLASDPAGTRTVEPLLHSARGNEPPKASDFLLRDFSSHPYATVEATEQDGRMTVAVTGGSIGKIGESTLAFGSISRRLFPCVQIVDAQGNLDRVGAFATAISLPVEHFANDLYVHRSILDLESLRTSIHSTLAQPLTDDESQHRKTVLPIDLKTEVHHDASTAPALESVPHHHEMLSRAFASMELATADCVLVRVVMQYPPVPSTLWVAWDLPPAKS